MTQHSEDRLDTSKILIMLGGLEKAIDMIIKTLSEDRTASAQYRSDIRNEIAAVRTEYHTVRADMIIVKEKLEQIEPKVTRLEEKDNQHEGAKKFALSMGSFFGKVIQLGLGAAGGAIAVLGEKMLHK